MIERWLIVIVMLSMTLPIMIALSMTILLLVSIAWCSSSSLRVASIAGLLVTVTLLLLSICRGIVNIGGAVILEARRIVLWEVGCICGLPIDA